MCHVTIVELIKLKILLDFLFIDIIQYKKYKIIDISQFSFFGQSLGPKVGLNNPRPLLLAGQHIGITLLTVFESTLLLASASHFLIHY